MAEAVAPGVGSPGATASRNGAGGVTEPAGRLTRFDGLERLVHWVNAVLFGVLIITGAALYWEPLMAVIGRRVLVTHIHVYAGLALPVPVVLALAGSWGRALRADFRRFNQWSAADREWLQASSKAKAQRLRTHRRLATGKFNAGQKLNAAFTAGAGLVMLGTGIILHWYEHFSLSVREGSTFVHIC